MWLLDLWVLMNITVLGWKPDSKELCAARRCGDTRPPNHCNGFVLPSACKVQQSFHQEERDRHSRKELEEGIRGFEVGTDSSFPGWQLHNTAVLDTQARATCVEVFGCSSVSVSESSVSPISFLYAISSSRDQSAPMNKYVQNCWELLHLYHLRQAWIKLGHDPRIRLARFQIKQHIHEQEKDEPQIKITGKMRSSLNNSSHTHVQWSSVTSYNKMPRLTKVSFTKPTVM